MFTGLVAGTGTVERPRPLGAGLTITVRHQLPWPGPGGTPLAPGESVNVDGCCLTVANPRPGRFDADLSPETLARTGGRLRWRTGRVVHLERALAAGDRMGGHVVQGHADGLLRIVGVRRRAGGWLTLRLELPAADRPLATPKGSVALDGVSLTVARRGPGWFEVALIPTTLAATRLGSRRPGDRMIVEWDVLARVALDAAAGRGPRTAAPAPPAGY